MHSVSIPVDNFNQHSSIDPILGRNSFEHDSEPESTVKNADNANGEPSADPAKPPQNVITVVGFTLDMDKLQAVGGIIRGINIALLLIMFICAVAGKGAAAAFKFQIVCWVLFTPMVIFFILKDYSVEGPPQKLGCKCQTLFRSIFSEKILKFYFSSRVQFCPNGDLWSSNVTHFDWFSSRLVEE